MPRNPKRFPGSRGYKPSISSSVIEILKKNRGVDKKTAPKQKRKEKVPGKSISTNDLEGTHKVRMNLVSPEHIMARTSTPLPDSLIQEDGNSSVDSLGGVMVLDQSNVTEGTFVLVNYEGSLFPGKVLSAKVDGAVVRVMIKCGKGKGWKWPIVPDELEYEWGDVMSVVDPEGIIAINKSGAYRIPELEDIYGTSKNIYPW